ncbi:methyltransferase domain-containing protein [Candidatus Poribacteria bacterium]|nr:methyltransferase domain-containing protein [Candidatus Poribacteria bacterium]
MNENNQEETIGKELDTTKMPGHWLLARLGKRVLRPGGRELTQQMLNGLGIQSSDEVVEFAPGLGFTTQLTLSQNPASYIAVERDEDAANAVRRYLSGDNQTCLIGRAEETGLPDANATVVYGEAMLTMQTPGKKQQIVQEAFRLMKPSGRYGIHELCLVPDDLDEDKKQEIQKALTDAIHVGARPLTISEWRALLECEGFTIQSEAITPMHLLEPKRLIQDEGFGGALRFVGNVLRDNEARNRVKTMRKVFQTYEENLAAIMLVGIKNDHSSEQ